MAEHTTTIVPKPASGNGDIDGFQITCTCGWDVTCSLKGMAEDWAAEHVQVMSEADPFKTNIFLILVRIQEAATFADARVIYDAARKVCRYRQDQDALAKAMCSRPDHPMRTQKAL